MSKVFDRIKAKEERARVKRPDTVWLIAEVERLTTALAESERQYQERVREVIAEQNKVERLRESLASLGATYDEAERQVTTLRLALTMAQNYYDRESAVVASVIALREEWARSPYSDWTAGDAAEALTRAIEEAGHA